MTGIATTISHGLTGLYVLPAKFAVGDTIEDDDGHDDGDGVKHELYVIGNAGR